MGEPSADRAARADLRVADVVQGLRQQRARLCRQRRALGFGLGHGGADHERAVVPLDPAELRDRA